MHFNPRSRVGNDQAWRKWHGDENISIHVPAWGTTNVQLGVTCSLHYFNPRSRVGNDSEQQRNRRFLEISIHVPAWGTTNQRQVVTLTGKSISIHVPAWGTTKVTEQAGARTGHFNPRSRVGNDTFGAESESSKYVFQSTFPRGERLIPAINADAAQIDFNPRSRVGNDGGTKMAERRYTTISIHVPAWGTTELRHESLIIIQNFNPRSRVGNDRLAGQ